jgi:hypothetical protein
MEREIVGVAGGRKRDFQGLEEELRANIQNTVSSFQKYILNPIPFCPF